MPAGRMLNGRVDKNTAVVSGHAPAGAGRRSFIIRHTPLVVADALGVVRGAGGWGQRGWRESGHATGRWRPLEKVVGWAVRARRRRGGIDGGDALSDGCMCVCVDGASAAAAGRVRGLVREGGEGRGRAWRKVRGSGRNRCEHDGCVCRCVWAGLCVCGLSGKGGGGVRGAGAEPSI